MASIKVLLWNKQNKEGLYPIVIRVIKDRKPSYLYVGHYIEKSQWDEKNSRVKKSNPNSVRLNNLIAKKLSEANDKLIDLEVQKTDSSSKAIKRSIKSGGNALFIQQAELYLQGLKENGKFNRHTADKPRIERLKEFLNKQGMGVDIPFSEITPQFLEKFKTYLKSTYDISERTIVNYLIVIRTIFNAAIGSNLVERKYYPFGKGKVGVKFPETLKIGLSVDEVKQLEDLELMPGSSENHARNMWLFSFYFAGMRVSDVLRLRWSDFQNERLHYSMGKNNKGGSLKVPEKVLNILKQYEDLKTGDNDLVFPELKLFEGVSTFALQKQIANADRTLNKWLRRVAKKAEITKPLTMHIARHTFGNISGDKIPVQMLQKLYRHSSITTTIGYQANFIHKDADDALDAVVGF